MKKKLITVAVFFCVFSIFFIGTAIYTVTTSVFANKAKGKDVEETSTQLSEAVLAFKPSVEKYAEENNISEYTNILLAIMQVSTSGNSTDVMLSKDFPENTKYLGEIPDKNYSIECGVKHFAYLLNLAGCKGLQDTNTLLIVIQSYNFNEEFIEYAKAQEKFTTLIAQAYYQEMGLYIPSNPSFAEQVSRYIASLNILVGGEYVFPITNINISSPFGMRKDPINGRVKLHGGVDFAIPTGTDVMATTNGIVKKVSYDATGYGHYCVLDHGNGVISIYGHCSQILVMQGQTVTQGQIIALSGNSGHSTGAHLHFEIRQNNQRIDPLIWIANHRNTENLQTTTEKDVNTVVGDGNTK